MKKVLILVFSLFLWASAKYTNDLIFEESPYLLQHAHNPVNWMPWGEKAFEKARREHKPIFLSIGYSTCHWCHVMEKESFENEEIANLLNEYYVPVKVDKEERPDLDRFYQRVYWVMHHRSGGWPLTIIMTENKIPFFSATYIPPEDGYGVEGMKTILPKLAKLYKSKKTLLEQRGKKILHIVQKSLEAKFPPIEIDVSLANRALKQIEADYDPIFGGFSKRVKFPQASTIELLLDIWLITGNDKPKEMADLTLTKMAKGGIFDQIEGAFFRYSVDRRWEIPHFEKMLYTNAELIRVYTRAYRWMKKPLFAEVVRRTIQEIDRRFGYKGLYFSASDADSKEGEGRYYLFDYANTLQYLKAHGIANPQKELKNLGILEDGNFDGEFSNPHLSSPVSAKTLELLRQLRQKRDFPFIDKKIITAWNAMMIDAKIQASYIDQKYLKEAIFSLKRLLQTMLKKGRVYHQMLPDSQPKKEGMLEDYAYLIKALLSAYEFTLNESYLHKAKALFLQARRLFYKDGIWYLSSSDDVKTPANLDDNYYSSPLAVMYHNILSLAALQYDLSLNSFAKESITQKSRLFHSDAITFATAVRAALRVAIGDVLVKGDRKRLLDNLRNILHIKYPYLLIKAEHVKDFEACSVDRCFANAQTITDLEYNIVKRVKKPKRIGWQADGQR